VDLESVGGLAGLALLITASGTLIGGFIGAVVKVVGSVAGMWRSVREENDRLEKQVDVLRAERRQAEDDRDRYRRRLAKYEDPDGTS